MRKEKLERQTKREKQISVSRLTLICSFTGHFFHCLMQTDEAFSHSFSKPFLFNGGFLASAVTSAQRLLKQHVS